MWRRRKKSSSPQARQLLGTLLVAWTVVTGLCAAFASAWYGRTGDVKVLIAYLGAPFAIGVLLFVAIGFYGLATRTRDREPIEPSHARLRPNRMFGRAAPPPRRHVEGASFGWIEPPAEATAWTRVSVRFRPEEDDLTEMNRVLLEPRHARLGVILLALAAAVGWAQLLAPDALALDAYAAAPALVLALGALGLAALLAVPRRRARRTLARETLLETEWRAGPNGLEMLDARGHGRYAWGSIRRVRETRGIFLVSTTDGAQHLIAKRDAAPATLARLRDVLRTHAGDRVKLRP